MNMTGNILTTHSTLCSGPLPCLQYPNTPQQIHTHTELIYFPNDPTWTTYY